MQQVFLKLSRIKNALVTQVSKYSVVSEMVKLRTTDADKLLDPRVRNVKDKLLYSDYIEKKQLKFGYKDNIKLKKSLEYKFKKLEELTLSHSFTPSVALKYLDEGVSADLSEKLGKHESNKDEELFEENHLNEKPIHMPYASTDKYEEVPIQNAVEQKSESLEPALQEKYKVLYEKYLEVSKYSVTNPSKMNRDFITSKLKIRLEDDYSKVPTSWMTDYEVYDDGYHEDSEHVKYGTPDPNSEISPIPCGGCGSLLHCKDVAIPGYLPSEIFLNSNDVELKSLTCQRCHFMKNYNTCLDVKVSADEYPKLLEQIKDKRCDVAVLLVDLTDFPCSIWPELPSIIGEKKHLYVVGNKIDLLPKDSPKFLDQVKDCLTESLINTGITKSNIRHIGLISAKTGYGIEQLINKLHKLWKYRGDVYLIGCTNAGKSTLFNSLLQSDFCKSQAVDLVQRATTSPWPGTTLNLLKFPILNCSHSKLYLRTQRLIEQRNINELDEKLRFQELKKSRNIELATLQSRISHTFKRDHDLSKAIKKSNNADTITMDRPTKFGLDENADEYKYSRWCYDTPGTIQPDQILHFLTTDELMKTLPNKIISPRTFCIWAGQTIFIAGLGRLDILNAPKYIRCTVFASEKLPITICKTEDADDVYNELLHTEAFVVPINNPERLKMWPELNSKDLETIGIGKNESASDVVLSNAGWIAITALEDETITMRGWTPEGRGIYLRTPALLPKSVTLRGMRKIGSPAYHLGRQVHRSKKVNVLK